MAKMTVELEAPGMEQAVELRQDWAGPSFVHLRVDAQGTPLARFHVRITDGRAELLHAFTNGDGQISAGGE